MIIRLSEKQIVENCFEWIKRNTIEKYYTIRLEDLKNKEELIVAKSFIEYNPEIYNLINTLLSTISNEKARSISIAQGYKSLFITYSNRDKTMTFLKEDLVKMLENFDNFKKAYCIYADFLKRYGFKCLHLFKSHLL